ncbi:Retrotransposon gag protein [Gossypium australe]|uniref:Retrotransposon gag protein n=1 Tax=Gossypium australe TaxID=47621 RepID=A0A5B6X288_9ROSI|nr:Retrotransposon gag protein [Gossypium australe]
MTSLLGTLWLNGGIIPPSTHPLTPLSTRLLWVDHVDRSLQQCKATRHIRHYHLKQLGFPEVTTLSASFTKEVYKPETLSTLFWSILGFGQGWYCCPHPPITARLKDSSHIHVGHYHVQPTLPLINPDGMILKESVRILDYCMVKKNNQVATEVLLEWVSSSPEDAIWESWPEL